MQVLINYITGKAINIITKLYEGDKKVELDEEEITITVASGIRQGCIESTNFQTSDKE